MRDEEAKPCRDRRHRRASERACMGSSSGRGPIISWRADASVRVPTLGWCRADYPSAEPECRRCYRISRSPRATAGRPIAASVTAPPCAGNRFRDRTFPMSRRCPGAIADYLDSTSASFGADASTPLLLSRRNTRLSRESTIYSWKTFLKRARCAREYQLEDVVLTGRLAFLRDRGAADPARELAGHAGISVAHAGIYVAPATRTLDSGG